MFDEEGLLIDIHERPLYSSSLPPDSSLIFIIRTDDSLNTQKSSRSQIDGNLFEKSIQQLEFNSRALSIIYAGRHFSELPSEVTDRIAAYTPSSSKTDIFFDKVSSTFPEIYGRATSVFRSRVSLEFKGTKCPSVWEDVSYILNESAFLASAPRESNVEILRAIANRFPPQEKSAGIKMFTFWVKIIDLQGKVILLLHTSPMMHMIPSSSALNDMYTEMQGSHQDLVEVVWIGLCDERERAKFERVAADAPWPVVPNPWLIKQSLEHFFTLLNFPWSRARVMVVDGKGRISNKNAWEMIERWGMEAFPFSEGREEELKQSEWELVFNYKQFVFQNLPFTQSKVEVEGGSHCGEIMLLFVGLADQMLVFSAELENALTKLKSDFQLYYVWHKRCSYKDDEEMKMKKKSTIPSISQMEAYRFWERMKYLYDDLTRMGSDEKIVHVRRLVSGIISAESVSHMEWKIQVIVVDEKGQMVSGEAKEVVEALSQWGKKESKLSSEAVQLLEGQRKDGGCLRNYRCVGPMTFHCFPHYAIMDKPLCLTFLSPMAGY
ncbi:hypothetical protein SUGI_0711290 [Cryptomeria japonica]|nr:hypothetical protein SUGI_0711290 [Cryptomeria japonica]